MPDQDQETERAEHRPASAHGQAEALLVRVPPVEDLDRDGVKDASEPALANWQVYVDVNKNGSLDAGEPTQLTDAQGNYEIETIVPGRYPIPPGLPGLEQYAGRTRPAHVHFTVMHPLFGPLTTQLYFPGEARNESDGIFSSRLLMHLTPSGSGREGRFNFVLSA